MPRQDGTPSDDEMYAAAKRRGKALVRYRAEIFYPDGWKLTQKTTKPLPPEQTLEKSSSLLSPHAAPSADETRA